MSEIRFQSQSLYQTHSTAGNHGFGPSVCTVGGGNETLAQSPFLSTGTTAELFTGGAWNRPSNPQRGSSLVQMQSDTANAITNPSGGDATDDNIDPRLIGEQTSRGAKSVTSITTALGRSASNFGRFAKSGAPFIGLVGTAFILPESFSKAGKTISTARETGDGQDINRAVGATTSAVGNTAKGVKAGYDTYNLVNQSQRFAKWRATRSAASAFRQSAPNATRPVVNAAARTAAKEALKNGAANAAHVSNAARTTAKGGGTLAKGLGTVGRNGARVALREGGEAAAKAATRAVATSALKTGAKAGARFVPGLNVAIAALDVGVAASTIADPKASLGKKITAGITAIGSVAAATNIPVVSQVGAAVSAVSSFVGSFF
jgi:hypothetical protein